MQILQVRLFRRRIKILCHLVGYAFLEVGGWLSKTVVAGQRSLVTHPSTNMDSKI
jgi:hypothetical protein